LPSFQKKHMAYIVSARASIEKEGVPVLH
jgi:hypothetical protein